MEDGTIKIGTKIDTAGAEKGLSLLQKGLTKVADSKVLKGIYNVGTAVGGISIVAKTASGLIGKLAGEFNAVTDAFRVQTQAETQLASAAKNNPYLNGESVEALKKYASELQGLSTFGDEELLPFMAQLAGAGRTQNEIMDIMAAATDIAASGTMSLESAVHNLNKTFGGYAGELGRTIPEVNALTSEQLKNGDAVKILASKYKGMAQAAAGATGSSKQLANAVGDLKEELGAPFEKALVPMRRFFTELVGGWADALKAKRKYQEAAKSLLADSSAETNDFLDAWLKNSGGDEQKAQKKAKQVVSPFLAAFNEAGSDAEKMKALFANLETSTGYSAENIIRLHDAYGLFNKQNDTAIAQIKEQIALEKQRAREEAANAEKERAAAEALQAQKKARAEADSKAVAALAEYAQAVKEAADAVKFRKQAGEAITDEQAAQEILNAKIAAYVRLRQTAGATLSDENTNVKKITADILAQAQAVNDAAAELDAYTEAKEAISEIYADAFAGSEDSLAVQLAKQVDALEAYYKTIGEYAGASAEEKKALEEEYTAAHKALCEQRTAAEKAEAEASKLARLDAAQKALTIANDFTQQLVQITSSMTDMAGQYAENEATLRTAELDKQYEDGLISLEEYEAKKADIEKDAAEKKYRIDMWEWTSNTAAAAANTALAVVNALSTQPAALGIAMAALVSAAGAAQLATIISNKPIPPSFATGGIVGGTSYTGDRVLAAVNSREMILNAGQQRNLFDAINAGNFGQSAAPNIVIHNSAANLVRAKTQITEEKIGILIDERVNEGLKSGKYGQSLTMANQGMNGETWGI